MRKNQNKGFSLIEVTIVLAISMAMIGIVAGVYAQRRSVTNDDAAKQLAANIQKVRNEAQKGLGPTNNTVFASGETLFGEAIEFRNSCTNSQPCLRVYKLKEGVTPQGNPNNVISVYETYDVPSPQGFQFSLISDSGNSCAGFMSCYALPGTPAGLYLPLSASPVLAVSGFDSNMMVVVRNGSGDMYAFNKRNDGFCVFNNSCDSLTNDQLIGPNATDKTRYTQNRRGILRLATGQVDGDVRQQATWDNARSKYFVEMQLSGSSAITVTRQ